MVDEFPQAQVPGEGGRQEQAGIGHQAMVVKEDADTVGIVLWRHLVARSLLGQSIGSLFPGGFLFQNHYPRFRGAPNSFFKGCPSKAVLRWIRAYWVLLVSGRVSAPKESQIQRSTQYTTLWTN